MVTASGMNAMGHVWMPTIRAHSGGDVFVERLASGLRERGWTVTIDWFDQRYEFVPGALSSRRPPQGTQIIHANAQSGYAFAGHGLPLIVTEHHFVLDPAYRSHKSALQHMYHRLVTGRAALRSMREASLVTTHSRFVARTVMDACPRVRPRIIPLWVDLERFSPSLPAPREGRPLRLLFVGNVSRRKGFDMVLALAGRLGADVEIRCTGGLRGVDHGDLPTNVVALGRLSDDELVQAYRDCDAALVPSRYEGFGYSALEAMACGRAVLGFACGSVEEIILDGEHGFLVPVNDIDGLEHRARQLLADAALLARLGAAGRYRAETLFTERLGVDAYIGAYADVLASHRRA
ncbi:MAG: 2-deoxystreptamine N-acetyl-D-glucosaminyltransferase [Luteibacter sp.]|nr:MAG: 2-deoxystreptamine N-acetyl-D-glucosaminyltransferase [Luteibacter sp.]